MNNLVNINTSLEDVLVDFLVRQMINPNNKQFYVRTMTLTKVKAHLLYINDDKYNPMFFKAVEIARQVVDDYTQVEKDHLINEMFVTCPHCGCVTYIPKVACPNCEYIED